MKGVLYTKIDLSRNLKDGKQQYLHLFQTHMQASYFQIGLELYVETYLCRYQQLKEISAFIAKKLGSIDRLRDLAILAGDFNQNGGKLNSNQLERIEQLKEAKKYNPIKKMFTDEYSTMLKALESSEFEVVDCMWKRFGKLHVTHADAYLSDDGSLTCASPVLTNKADSGT